MDIKCVFLSQVEKFSPRVTSVFTFAQPPTIIFAPNQWLQPNSFSSILVSSTFTTSNIKTVKTSDLVLPLDEAVVDGEGGEDHGDAHCCLHGLHDGRENEDHRRHQEIQEREDQIHSENTHTLVRRIVLCVGPT